jgi:class 3 adenylate cyclase/tetratricopeptide (TPR) repeat protein
VTVLFADLKGSMELLADRDPEEARKLLDPVLERMIEAVHRYDGTVNQVMGDGIMALFGAPLAHEDHAVRACYAALRMQESVKKYAEDVRRSHAAVVKIRVGLNSGEVVVRAIGSDLHMDYTAVGQTTHLAARMEQIADPGAIVITPETLALAEGFVEVKSLGPVSIKGLATPVEIYDVVRAGPVRTRLQAATRRGLTRFVGRDAEMEQLRRAQQLAADGHGQVAAVVGEAGAGKSRLFYEFTHSHRLHGWLVLEATSVSYGKATSYLPVIDLLKAYFKIQSPDDPREIREKVTGKLLALDRALEPTIPALLALLEVRVDEASWPALDPGQRRQRTLDAVKRLLLREAREQPLLLVFEDLHWIDGETQALLDGLVESLGSARLLLLVNYRPGYQHTWGSKSLYAQIRLDALPTESTAELLDALLGDDSGLAPLKQLLLRRGNPFFLEETVRTLLETKALAGERGQYRLTQPLPTIQVPTTVQAMLAARIDRLSPEDKRLLQVASVIGKDVPGTLLLAVAELSEDALRRGLGHLQAAEFVDETGLFPDFEYSFKHALTHEVTYGGLLQGRRRELHGRVVGAIETLHHDRLGEHTERLAHHALRGELWDQAFTYCQVAGAKSIGRSAYREALVMLEGAQQALSHLPEGRETLERGIDVRLELQPVFNALGDLSRMLELLGEAERLAESIDDQPRLARVLAYTSRCFWWMGLPHRGVAAGERALEIASRLDDRKLEVIANYHLGLAYITAGEFVKALGVFRRSEAILQGERAHERFGMPALPSVIARTWIAFCHASLGDFDEAITSADDAVRLAENADHPYSVAVAVQGTGLVYALAANLTPAIHWLERALELSRTGGFAVLVSLSLSFLGRAFALVGRADARQALEDAGAHIEAIRFTAFHPSTLTALAEVYGRDGRRADAKAMLDRALDLARTNGQRAQEVDALLALGELTASADSFRQALGIAEELGARPLIAHCHLGLGKLHRRAGKNDLAAEHLNAATAMYRAMSMPYWFDQATTEQGRLGP